MQHSAVPSTKKEEQCNKQCHKSALQREQLIILILIIIVMVLTRRMRQKAEADQATAAPPAARSQPSSPTPLSSSSSSSLTSLISTSPSSACNNNHVDSDTTRLAGEGNNGLHSRRSSSELSTESNLSYHTAPLPPITPPPLSPSGHNDDDDDDDDNSSSSSDSSTSRSSSTSSNASLPPFPSPPPPWPLMSLLPRTGSDWYRRCGLFLVVLLLGLLGIYCHICGTGTEKTLAPPCHARPNPNLLAPCCHQDIATRLAALLHNRHEDEAWRIIDASIYSDQDLPPLHQVDDLLLHHLPRLLPDNILKKARHLVQHTVPTLDLAEDTMRILAEIPTSFFLDPRHDEVLEQIRACSPEMHRNSPWFRRVQQRYNCLHNSVNSSELQQTAYHHAIQLLSDWEHSMLAPLRNSQHSPSTSQNSLDTLITQPLTDLYAVLDHLAALLDPPSPNPEHLQQLLRPLLFSLRRVELHLILAEAALVVLREHRRAQAAFAAQLEKMTLSETLEILSCGSGAPTLDHSPASFADLLRQVRPPCDWEIILTRLLHTVRNSWEPRIPELGDTLIPQVRRLATRRWAMQRWSMCGESPEQEHRVKMEHRSKGSFNKQKENNDSKANAGQQGHSTCVDSTGAGCTSHPSPFLRTWFSTDSWTLPATLVIDSNSWDLLERPGVLDQRRRPRFKGKRMTWEQAGWLADKCADWEVHVGIWQDLWCDNEMDR